MRARTLALARRLVLAAGGQCSWCHAWFADWNGGVCDACRAAGH
ncbi:hypothetical protein [Streptomyces sp. IBSBF 2806]